MKNTAVIDIGSNSMRVLVYEIYENHSFKIIDEEKRMTRLGQFIDKTNNLSNSLKINFLNSNIVLLSTGVLNGKS